MINYIFIIGALFPGVQVSCRGDVSDYSTLVWEAGDPLPTQMELDLEYYRYVKDKKVTQLSADCEIKISQYGFISDALGQDYLYDSQLYDQINLLGSLLGSQPSELNPSGTSSPYAVREPANVNGGIRGPKEYKMHTYAQLVNVIEDGKNFKLGILIKFNSLRDYLNQNTLTLEQIESFTLDTVIPLPGI